MLRLLRWVVYGDGHLHKWETIKEVEIIDVNGQVIRTRYYCKCEVCGEYKKFD